MLLLYSACAFDVRLGEGDILSDNPSVLVRSLFLPEQEPMAGKLGDTGKNSSSARSFSSVLAGADILFSVLFSFLAVDCSSWLESEASIVIWGSVELLFSVMGEADDCCVCVSCASSERLPFNC